MGVFYLIFSRLHRGKSKIFSVLSPCLAFSGGRWYHLNEKKLIGDALWSCCTYIKIHGPPWEPRPLIPFYRLTDTDIVLLDTGIAASDREGLTALLEEHGLRPKGILCSHAHYDHVGNAAYLRRRYGCPIAMPMIEAAICADATAFRANYETLTYGTIQSMFPEECFLSDVLISPDIDHLDFCGVRFGLLPLPGHSAGQMGFITPDGTAYLADCLLGPEQLQRFKLPTIMHIARDLTVMESLRSLRCPVYVLAHKTSVTELGPVIDANIAAIHDKGRRLLSCLTDGMTADQWLYAYCRQEGIHTHDPFRISVTQRNFLHLSNWLVDEGQVALHHDLCVSRYSKV